jgi:hypothetical protein
MRRQFISTLSIAKEVGCDSSLVQEIAPKLLEQILHSLLINGITGSLVDAFRGLDPKSCHILGAIYVADSGGGYVGPDVDESLSRIASHETWEPALEEFTRWRNSLSEEEQHYVRMAFTDFLGEALMAEQEKK